MSEIGNIFEDWLFDVVEIILCNYMWGIVICYIENLEEGLNMLFYLIVEIKGEIVEMDGGCIEVMINGDFYRVFESKWVKYVY